VNPRRAKNGDRSGDQIDARPRYPGHGKRGFSSSGRHVLKAIRPPSARTRRISRTAAARSGKKLKTLLTEDNIEASVFERQLESIASMPGNIRLDGTRDRDHLGLISTPVIRESAPSRSRAAVRRCRSRRRRPERDPLGRGSRGPRDPLPRDERVMKQGFARRSRKSSARSHRMHPAGLEPTTYSSGGCRSIQLSYGCVGGEVRAIRNPNQAVRA
jgi:hypothetical protein